MSDTPNEYASWGQQNPWEMMLPNGQPNPYFNATPKTHTGDTAPAPTSIPMPDFSRKLDSSQPGGVAPVDPNRDPNPKRHGSLPVVIPPRTLHVV